MNITSTPDALRQGLSLVKHAVANRPRIPILTHVLLVAEGDRLRLSATNLGLGITCWVEAHILEEGAVTLPWGRLNNFIGSLPHAPTGAKRALSKQGKSLDSLVVELEAPPDSVTVSLRCGRSKASITGMPAADFPALPTLERGLEGGDAPVSLNVALLCSMVEQVAFAVGEGNRSGLSDVHMRFRGDHLALAVKDSLRVAICEASLHLEGVAGREIVVPAKDLAETARLLQGTGEEVVQVAVNVERRRIVFHTPVLDCVSYLSEEAFRDFAQFVPADYGARVVVGTASLIAALKFVAFVARQNRNRVDLSSTVQSESGAVLVSAHAQGLGGQATEIDALSVAGAGRFQCQLERSRLAEVLSAVGTACTALEWDTSTNSLVVRPVNGGSPLSVTYVLLPGARA